MSYRIRIWVFVFGGLGWIQGAFAESKKASLFKNESELGIVSSMGNARSQTLNARQSNSYEFGANLVKLNGSFLRTSAQGQESAKNWNVGVRFERAISDRFSLLVGQNVESDEYAGYRNRYNTDVGGKYFFLKNDNVYWDAEAGYRFTSEENLSSVFINSQRLRAYSELEKKWTDVASGKISVEYVPNLTDSRDWLLNSEVSASAVLTAIFSLKIGYGVKYDNLPEPDRKKTDSVFTTSLVAKF